MDPKLKLELIQRAQKELVSNPQDFMHEISHHCRVVMLMKELLIAEKLQDSVDLDLLEVICWWHDVKVRNIEYPEDQRVVQTTARYLASLLPEGLRDKAYDSMTNHEFGSAPNYIEGKVLQDVDKLEILSEARVDLVVDNIKAKVADRGKILQTLQSIKTEWLPKMPERYHFNFSKNYHNSRVSSFLNYLAAAEELIKNLRD